MPYLNLDPNYFDHPKTRRLVGLLGQMADVLPLRLWAYCARVHPSDGAMSRYSDLEIEGVIHWIGVPKEAVRALCAVGFLKPIKNGFSCVDWLQHEGHLKAFRRRGIEASKARWAKYATSNAASNAKKNLSNAPSVPSIPSIPTTKNPLPPKRGNVDGFDQFWDSYPKKVGKLAALKVWKKIGPTADMQARIVSAIRAQRYCEQWTKDGGQYIPHPATWLNQGRWDDEIRPTTPQNEPALVYEKR